MKLLCLLVVVGFAAAADPSPHAPHAPHAYGKLDIYTLKELTAALEADTQKIAKDISDATTLGAVIDEEINEINDFFIANINTENAQQSDLIASYQAQAETLQHRVDAAKALEKEAISLAEATLDSVNEQIDKYLNGSGVKGVNMEQEMLIEHLEADLIQVKHDFLSNLTDTITHLEAKESEAEGKLATLNAFVADRKCEYGFGFLDEGLTTISFKTKFTTPPTVTLSLSGFVAHLDNYKHAYDVLSLSKEVHAESTDHFTVNAQDNSEGQVDVTYVSCSWMACQSLNKDVDLKHP